MVQANILAALTTSITKSELFNIACGTRITLNELSHMIRDIIKEHHGDISQSSIIHGNERKGDIFTLMQISIRQKKYLIINLHIQSMMDSTS